MPPKKRGKEYASPFYQFMLELKNQPGRNIRSMAEAAEIAGPLWAQMSKEQRRPYEERAKKEKFSSGKLTSTGRDIELVEKEENEEKEKLSKLHERIVNELTVMNENRELANYLFFVIHINNFFYCTMEGQWYPGEVAVASFSLAEGITDDNIFHSIVKPGRFPLGYAAEAKITSEKSHQLLRSPYDTENNVEEVFKNLKLFLQTRVAGKSYLRYPPIIFAEHKYMEMVSSVLNTWSSQFGEGHDFEVYSLQKMFTILKNVTLTDAEKWTDTFGFHEIEKDVNAYCLNISCDYHENAGVIKYCSKSIVTRYVYTICDNCCSYLGIELQKGHHVPLDAITSSSITTIKRMSDLTLGPGKSSKPSTSIDDDSSTVQSFARSDWETQSEVSTLTLDDDFHTLGSEKPAAAKNPWNKFNPGEGSSGSYSGAVGFTGGRGKSYSSLSFEGTEGGASEFPEIRGRGKRVGGRKPLPERIGRGRGNVYEK